MLKRYLAANAAFSTVSGLVLITAGDWLGRHIPAPGWLWPALGAGLLLFAVQLVAMTRSPALAARLASGVVAMDAAWVVLTTIVLVWRWPMLTTIGAGLIIDVNLVVAALAWLQWRAYRRERGYSANA